MTKALAKRSARSSRGDNPLQIVRPVQQELDLFNQVDRQWIWSPAFLAQTCLPYSEVSTSKLVDGAYERRNGDITMRVWSPLGASGIPFGKFPRQFLIWLGNVMVYRPDLIESDVLRIKLPFKEFCRQVGVDPSRGARGSGRALVEQMRRLMTCDFNMTWKMRKPVGGRSVTNAKILKFSVSTAMDISWIDSEDRPREWLDGPQSGFRLSRDFVGYMKDHHMILNPDHVAALCKGKSPLRLDTYIFLAYRNHGLVKGDNAQAVITWDQLFGQFGCLMDRSDFIRSFRREAKHIQSTLWPELKMSLDNPQAFAMWPAPHPTPISSKPGHPIALSPPPRRSLTHAP